MKIELPAEYIGFEIELLPKNGFLIFPSSRNNKQECIALVITGFEKEEAEMLKEKIIKHSACVEERHKDEIKVRFGYNNYELMIRSSNHAVIKRMENEVK